MPEVSTAPLNTKRKISYYRAEDKLDNLSDETNMLENELKQTKKTTSRRYNEPFANFYAKFKEKLAYVTIDDEQQMIQITEKLNGRYRSRIDDGTNYANKLRAEGRYFRYRKKGYTSFNCPKNNRVNGVNYLAIMPASSNDLASDARGVPLAESENE
ncbi:hypothetical protein D6C80_04878 [Aureobasidium pullulans]|nr:hypothetical protein D6C80_04878 [Aureobasidium pullulans]